MNTPNGKIELIEVNRMQKPFKSNFNNQFWFKNQKKLNKLPYLRRS